MFIPKYTITHSLLANITKINSLVNKLNNQRFANLILLEFEKTAREVSAYTSTNIEGNPLSLTQVKKILKSKPTNIKDTQKEIINYNQALKTLNKLLKNKNPKLSLKIILDIHRQITQGLLPDHDSGSLRKRPVIVNDPQTAKTVYLPPDIKKVNTLTTDLIDFINKNSTKVNPLILAGIFHKQMLIIHPFMNGNGRTTRLITKMLLAKMGLNTFNLFSFENYYNQNITKYFQTVGEYGDYNDLVDKINFTNWLEYFTQGIIDELLRVTNILPKTGNSPKTKLESHHLKILKHIKKNGFITQRDYSKLTNRTKPTRVLDFLKLIDLQLIQRKGKGRSTHYILSEK